MTCYECASHGDDGPCTVCGEVETEAYEHAEQFLWALWHNANDTPSQLPDLDTLQRMAVERYEAALLKRFSPEALGRTRHDS